MAFLENLFSSSARRARREARRTNSSPTVFSAMAKVLRHKSGLLVEAQMESVWPTYETVYTPRIKPEFYGHVLAETAKADDLRLVVAAGAVIPDIKGPDGFRPAEIFFRRAVESRNRHQFENDLELIRTAAELGVQFPPRALNVVVSDRPDRLEAIRTAAGIKSRPKEATVVSVL